MSYYTYFTGKLNIDLKEPYLNILKEYLSKQFENKNINISVDQQYLKVEDEWKDSGLMQKIVLFIHQKGRINSGSILCEGEDQKDLWEINIRDNKPFILEHGSYVTLSRLKNKELFGS